MYAVSAFTAGAAVATVEMDAVAASAVAVEAPPGLAMPVDVERLVSFEPVDAFDAFETFDGFEVFDAFEAFGSVDVFATLDLEYVPDQLCVELKSLKLYIWSFRDRGAFHEAVTNEIADMLAATLKPRYLRLAARFNVRGGIETTVVAEHRQLGWSAPLPVSLP